MAVASRLTLPLKFSATVLLASRASTVTPNGVPACMLATTVVITSWRAVTLKALLTPLVSPVEVAVTV